MAGSRSYWTTYREARARHGLTDREARRFVAEFRDTLNAKRYRRDGKVVGRDLDRHPRIARRLAEGIKARPIYAEYRKLPPTVKPKEAKPERVAPPVPPKAEEEWEVTIHYESRGRVVDVSVSLIGPAGADAALVRRVLWHWMIHGDLDYWDVRAIDWRAMDKRRRVRTAVGDDSEENRRKMRALARAGTIRIALVG